MTTPELIRLALMFYVGMCIMTMIAFIAYMLFSCVIGLWDKRRTPTKRMHVEGKELVEVEEVV